MTPVPRTTTADEASAAAGSGDLSLSFSGDSWVQFGDGRTGQRLPSGVGNVEAAWRTGVGAYGPPNAGTSPQPGGRLDGLNEISLPCIVTGGEQPESGDVARTAAPGKIQ